MFRYYRFLPLTVLLVAPGWAGAAHQKSEQSQSEQSQKDNAKDSDEIYVPGGDVKPPRVIHYVEPEASASSQDAYVEGVVRLSAVVNLDGGPGDLHVTKGLTSEEDRLALEAVKQWRFEPGSKKGQPVRVRINIEISFHLL